jgi:hypothetical protein
MPDFPSEIWRAVFICLADFSPTDQNTLYSASIVSVTAASAFVALASGTWNHSTLRMAVNIQRNPYMHMFFVAYSHWAIANEVIPLGPFVSMTYTARPWLVVRRWWPYIRSSYQLNTGRFLNDPGDRSFTALGVVDMFFSRIANHPQSAVLYNALNVSSTKRLLFVTYTFYMFDEERDMIQTLLGLPRIVTAAVRLQSQTHRDVYFLASDSEHAAIDCDFSYYVDLITGIPGVNHIRDVTLNHLANINRFYLTLLRVIDVNDLTYSYKTTAVLPTASRDFSREGMYLLDRMKYMERNYNLPRPPTGRERRFDVGIGPNPNGIRLDLNLADMQAPAVQAQ